ncbi:polar amino acid transport system substrate-binding protein [Mycetocola sp. BIGb0189]|uniref:ABC transporter substrate-binding protein n=1 Tax=Mycetocola sp. BIGb0189 TaxID=2940604 RepID=UPI002168D8AB|nr:ABC transporter substrate-binding protein [Mycetocola sp. BIGb0189]MCS4276143.1 polar amino acid transport system substrate-binding protein [Mycetocola sp. BIGb0189]
MNIRITRRRRGLILGAALTALGLLLAGCAAEPRASAPSTGPFDLTTKNVRDRPRIDPVPEAVAALQASGFTPAKSGTLTVAHAPFTPPILFLAEDDNKTILGSDADFAQLIADGLGLTYAPKSVSWADWPLGVQSGKYDIGASNITVTEERKDLFDFATYRDDVVSFAVAKDSAITRISEAKDVSGKKVVVGSGTNQEKVLLGWFAANEAAGLPPGEAVYFDDVAAATLALTSGRVDATLGPNATNAYRAATTGETKLVGAINGGYPANAEIGAVTARGNGLAEPIRIVLDALIADGTYARVLARWSVESEGLERSQVNPPGLPRE